MYIAEHIIFYAFALTAVVSATYVVIARNPVQSVLALVVTFFAMSAIWMMLEAEFLSLILILVYVGAVMTLFLFVVMMLNITAESKQSGFVRFFPVGIVLVSVLAVLMVFTVGPHYFGVQQIPVAIENLSKLSNTEQLGMVLYTE
jgi:NADH-quinone oxidoreductase subunit J